MMKNQGLYEDYRRDSTPKTLTERGSQYQQTPQNMGALAYRTRAKQISSDQR